MKRKHHKEAHPSLQTPTRNQTTPQAKRSRWVFRLAAPCLPVLFLLILELLLRLFGYGYSPNFFRASKVNGAAVFIENPKFSRRYFPPALARTPQPTLFAAQKAANTCRIFAFGESAAMGDPEPAFGFPRLLEILLQARNPGKHFEVINVAVTAINSHVIREIARDCSSKQGDFWVIYMGNNEVVGPYGAGTVFGPQTPSLFFIRASIALKALRVGQLLEGLRARFSTSRTPASWEGMEMFLRQQIRQSDPRMSTVYSHFERNLNDIVNLGERAGARVLLSSVASNLKGCPPFGSLHRSGLSNPQLSEWEKAYRSATEMEAATNLVEALQNFEKCAGIDDQYAELQFRMARCLAGLGKTNEARLHYILARDFDSLRFRADTSINHVIGTAAKRHKGAQFAFIDTADAFARNSPQNIPGQELLLEHVHLNFEGNYLLARTTAEQIAAMLETADAAPNSWLSVKECAERLAYTDWDRLQLVDELIRRLEQPPFNQQLDHKQQLARWQRERDALRQSSTAQLSDAIPSIYRRALALRPNDTILHENFATFLQGTGDPAGAEKEWRKVVELMPHSDQALYSLGNVLDAQGKSAEALTYFNLALQERPNSFEARNGVGLALSSQGKIDEAIANYRTALRSKPDFTEARINLGQALASIGRDDEAIAEYRAAIRDNSNSTAAHINLGKALAKKNLPLGAQVEYEAALALNPRDAVAHYNLGNLLAGRNPEQSLKHFEESVRADPRFAEARYNLGLALAATNRTSEAVAQFQEAARLRPQWVEARLNLGVALAKTQRYAEAISEFREVLRLDPNNAEAKRFLAQAQSLQQQ